MKTKYCYVVKEHNLNEKELALFTCLQGLVNLKEPRLLLDVDNYVNFLDKDTNLMYLTFVECLDLFLKEISECVLYTLSRESTEINAAFSYSAATGALAVPHGLEKLIESKLEVVEDLSKLQLNNIEIQRYVFRKFKERFAKDGLIHQPFQKTGKFLISLRDYAISKKWLVLYCGETKEERELLDEVLSFLNTGINVFGWTSDEISFIDAISKYGDSMIAMDWSSNHSYFGSFPVKKYSRPRKQIKVLPNKHYVCLCLSDGDNIQWLERDFAFGSFFGERNKVKRNFPMTFSISPALVDLNPKCLQYIYSNLTNEDFVCGVSGYGYMNPCVFPKEHIEQFAEHTNEYFAYCNLKVNTIIDNLANMNSENLEPVLTAFAKQENLIGCLYQVDPICYRGGKGKIFWKNDKPFVTARFSLWNTNVQGDNKPEFAPESLLLEIANAVNNMPKDKNSEQGYSYINVHPWSVHWWDVERLVSLFSEDIQILGAEQFIEMIRDNVKH